MESPKNVGNNMVVNNFKCEICDKDFSTRRSKSQHMNEIHGEGKHFVCNVCNKIFGKKNGLTIHIKNYHPGVPRNFKCDSCSKSFPQSGYLKKHIKIHEGQKLQM